jgi:hypothetical protein
MKIALIGCRFSLCLFLSIGLFAQGATAQDRSEYMAPAASPSGFGSGPLTISLIGSARMMAPVRGIETVDPSREMEIARPTDALVADGARTSLSAAGKNLAFAR